MGNCLNKAVGGGGGMLRGDLVKIALKCLCYL